MKNRDLKRAVKSVPRAVSHDTMVAASYDLCSRIDTPRSLTVWILLREKEYAQLVNLDIKSTDYDSSEKYADDYLVTKFLSKYPGFKHSDLNPTLAARKSFFEYEELCKLTNERFLALEEDPSLWDPMMRSILLSARRKISSLLREPDLDSISAHFGWGPGATTSASGSFTAAYVKFQSRLDVTSNSLIMGHCCVNSMPSWVNCQLQADVYPSVEASLTREAFNIVRGNEIVFVPKNAKTDRIIAKEPHVNSFLQKGFGSEIRRLLKTVSIDLDDQSHNQRYARLGSLTGNLATMDLKGASDTVSRELVRFLLPQSWYRLLDLARSKQGYIREDDLWICYNKFSSMGNAFTFELESLIFWALVKSTCEVKGHDGPVSVYGDDLIIPTSAYSDVCAVIDFAGFLVNDQKSFSTGRFRESCGKDYFDGFDVRPIFLKEELTNVESLYRLANNVRRYAHRRGSHRACDARFRHCWLGLVRRIPARLQGLLIPEGFGDIGLIANFDEATPSRPRFGWEGFVFNGLSRVPVKERMRDRTAAYAAILYHNVSTSIATAKSTASQLRIERLFLESMPLEGHFDLRAVTRPTISRNHTHEWCDLGPWE